MGIEGTLENIQCDVSILRDKVDKIEFILKDLNEKVDLLTIRDKRADKGGKHGN